LPFPAPAQLNDPSNVAGTFMFTGVENVNAAVGLSAGGEARSEGPVGNGVFS
jgi:hypothetical protein